MRSPKSNGQILKVGLFRGHTPLSRGHISPFRGKELLYIYDYSKIREKGGRPAHESFGEVKEGTSSPNSNSNKRPKTKNSFFELFSVFVLAVDVLT